MSNFSTSNRRPFVLSSLLIIALFGGWVVQARAADDDKPDFSELQRQFRKAYDGANYKKALEIAGKMHELRPADVNAIYNTACLHCLLGDGDQAYEWIEKAIDAGYRDADHMIDDADFRTIRGEDRFRRLVRRIRKLARDGRDESETTGEPKAEKKPKPSEDKKESKPSDAQAASPQEQFEKLGLMTRRLIEVSNAGKRDEALKIALEASGIAKTLYRQAEGVGDEQFMAAARVQLSLTNYNVACMYSLMKQPDKAFDYLNKAVATGPFGGNMAEQIKNDGDFDNIRKDERYAPLLEKAAKATPPPQPQVQRRPAPAENVKAQWKVTLPKGHNKSTEAPLLVALHHFNGDMEKATQRWQEAAAEVGAILLTPQGTVKSGEDKFHWGRDLDKIEADVMDAINKVMDEYKVDQDKIVVAGFSQGGWAAWGLAMRNPDTFCGVIPVAGRFQPESASAMEDAELARMRVFIMVGADDNSNTIDSNKDAAKLFGKLGTKVKLNIYDDIGHGFPEGTSEQVKALRFVLNK
jgi:predicted esterase